MPEKVANIEKIKRNGWKQGACLLIDKSTVVHTVTQCMQERLQPGMYIVLSQDCDILNFSLEKEPVVEVIAANQIQQCNAELNTGKNPRQLHLDTNVSNLFLEISPNNRHFISRGYLENYNPASIEITSRSLKILVNWIAKRYKRPGFPDAFNRRLDSKLIEKIKRILSNKAVNTRGLFIRLHSEEELPQSETYNVILKLLVPKFNYEDEATLTNIQNGFDKILGLLEAVKGIKIIEESCVQSEDDITLHHYLELKPWDFDYISFLNGEDGSETIGGIVV